MRNALHLGKKDLYSYFHSWMGVIVVTFFFLIAGLFFSFLVMNYSKISMDAAQEGYQNVQGLGLTRFVFGSFFLNMASVLIFLVPILSMRAFSEERRQGTLELLFTYPFSDVEIVMGKFFGLGWFLKLLLSPTLVFVILMHAAGGKLDWAPIAAGYVGFWLLANAYLSLGLFISAISENQVVSAIVTFGLLIIFWVLDWATSVAGGTLRSVLIALSPLGHYQDFTIGILDLSNIVYFCFFSLFFLFLSLRAIETRNWKA